MTDHSQRARELDKKLFDLYSNTANPYTYPLIESCLREVWDEGYAKGADLKFYQEVASKLKRSPR